MASLSYNKEAEIIQTFCLISSFLDDVLHMDNPYFVPIVGRIYPPDLQLNKASEKEAPFLNLHCSITNGFVSLKMYDKSHEFDFDINF